MGGQELEGSLLATNHQIFYISAYTVLKFQISQIQTILSDGLRLRDAYITTALNVFHLVINQIVGNY